MQEEHSTRLLDLPPELRTLIDFLDIDERATTVFHASHDGGHGLLETKVLYQNPACHGLAASRHEIQQLQITVERAIAQSKDITALHGQLVGGAKRWQIRISGGYIIAVEQAQYQQIKDVAVSTPSLDWTRNEIPNMSPWIRFIRTFDWGNTLFGPMESWGDALRSYVLRIMANPNPRLIVWGPEMGFLYNEACVELFGMMHPHCLGQVDAAYEGKVSRIDSFEFPIERHGFTEETFWDFTMLPLFDLDGRAIGAFDELTEATIAVVSERRRDAIHTLSHKVDGNTTLQDLWPAVLGAFDSFGIDMPFAILYSVNDPSDPSDPPPTSTDPSSSSTPKTCTLMGAVGLPSDHPDVVDSFPLSQYVENGPGIVQACVKAWKTSETVILSSANGSLPPALAFFTSDRTYGDPVRMAAVSPVNAMTGTSSLAIVVLGLSPRYPYNDEYKLFIEVLVDIIARSAALIALPAEQRRAQALADDVNSALTAQLRMTTLKAEKSEAKFTRLASTVPTGMFMFDSNGLAIHVNDTYLEMLGQTREQHNNREPDQIYWIEQVHGEDLDKFSNAWTRVLDEKLPLTLEYRTKKPWQSIDKSTGQQIEGERWLLATAVPELAADGTVATVQGWLTDISHKKFSENLLSQRLKDALENKRQTENFIDMTSHELRNPLSAILQSADSIVSTLDSAGLPITNESMNLPAYVAEDIVDSAQTIILCAQHQKRLVDDILTLSKLDASLLVISPDKVQPPVLVTKALKMYEAEIERAGIDTQLCIEPTYEALNVDWVILDPSRLLQVIINLLTNAIKFTQYAETRKIKICLGASYQKPTGKHHGITFVPVKHDHRVYRPEEDGNEDIYLQIAVYDTGRGLSEDEMNTLFQRFRQASPKTYKQYGGSGLGLFISRELCELQGGQIGVASSQGKTVFTFYVLAKRWIPEPGQNGTITEPTPPTFTSASASPMAFSRRGSLGIPAISSQMSVHRTNSGSVVEDFHPQTHFSARKRSVSPLPNTPTSQPPIPTPQQATGNHNQPLHVLIVEDNLINQKVMSQQLRRAGCNVHVANHGLECLDFLARSTFAPESDTSANIPLSVILLDLEMPTMDGLTCIRHIRAQQREGTIRGHVPVIAVTANARSEQISMAIEAGMDRVVTKPFRIPELVPQMEELVQEVEKGRMDAGR